MTPEKLLAFHKMHGAGNDFVLLDWRDSDLQLSAKEAAMLADRHLGVGCDQILIVRNSALRECAAAYEIRNADGSPAGQCGNGARCIALYLSMSESKAHGDSFMLDSPAGRIQVTRCPDGEFQLDMGEPRFRPENVPILLKSNGNEYSLDSPWGNLRFGAVSMGNPHALLQVDDTEQAAVAEIGPFLGSHEVFPEQCNIGFVQVLDRDRIRLRVYERGAGETLACGSGACAAVAILRLSNRVNESVQVVLPGGVLVIKWPGVGKGISMKGPATHVFSGTMPMRERRE